MKKRKSVLCATVYSGNFKVYGMRKNLGNSIVFSHLIYYGSIRGNFFVFNLNKKRIFFLKYDYTMLFLYMVY